MLFYCQLGLKSKLAISKTVTGVLFHLTSNLGGLLYSSLASLWLLELCPRIDLATLGIQSVTSDYSTFLTTPLVLSFLSSDHFINFAPTSIGYWWQSRQQYLHLVWLLTIQCILPLSSLSHPTLIYIHYSAIYLYFVLILAYQAWYITSYYLLPWWPAERLVLYYSL